MGLHRLNNFYSFNELYFNNNYSDLDEKYYVEMNHSLALCSICVACKRGNTLFFYTLYSFLFTQLHTKVGQSTIVFSCIMLRILV